jgi:hypothetical protein
MKLSCTIAVAALAFASTAQAASSDYLLELDGVKGEATVDSWSFGVCNTGQCSSASRADVVAPRDAATGMASGRTASSVKPNRASWDRATSKGGRMAAGGGGGGGGKVQTGLSQTGSALASGAAVVAGDVDGDGSPDLAFAGTQDEIYGLALALPASSAAAQAACSAGRIDSARLSRGDEVFAVSSVSVLCTKGGSGASAASYARSGINRIDSTPARISTNLTVAKQTQGATFGERCAAGSCDALTDGLLILRFTGGQMKYTKTGHVTLLK